MNRILVSALSPKKEAKKKSERKKPIKVEIVYKCTLVAAGDLHGWWVSRHFMFAWFQ